MRNCLTNRSKTDGVFLIRFSADGQEVGDTWHQSIEEAQEQAAFEFYKKLSDWVVVPPREIDPFFFGLKLGTTK